MPRKAVKRVTVRLSDAEIDWLYAAMIGYIEEGATDDDPGDPDALMQKLLRARARVRQGTE